MSEPKFSVVIPLHNKARHVAAAINSVLMQSLPPHEMLVIDDSSTDGSLEVVALISSPRLRVFSRKTPGPGGYAARNLGIAEATGDWIAFLDADDIWGESHLADIASAIGRSPTVGCVATRYDHVFDDRRVRSNMPRALADVEGRAINFAGFLKLWVDNGECPIWTSASAFRRDTLLQAGPFPAGKAVRGGDKDMWLRAVRRAPFAYVAKISAEFHRDSDNKVSKTTSPDTVPLVVATARDIMRSATAGEKSLLRQLINQQIGLYARFSFKSQRISAQLARNLCLPEGVGLYLLIEGMRLIPAALRHRLYHMFQGARKRRLAAYE
jgi:succinoglycan biosynthesis protein ExoO